MFTRNPRSPASTQVSAEVQKARTNLKERQKAEHIAAQLRGVLTFCNETCSLGQACCDEKGIPKGTCEHYKSHSTNLPHMCEQCIIFSGSTIKDAETVQALDTAPPSASGPSSGSEAGQDSTAAAPPEAPQAESSGPSQQNYTSSVTHSAQAIICRVCGQRPRTGEMAMCPNTGPPCNMANLNHYMPPLRSGASTPAIQ